MTLRELTTLRLINQQIAGAHGLSTAKLTRHMGAMQAQDYHGSLWALGLRTCQTQAEIIKAIESRDIIRTWPQRGTLHFVPSEDARWLVGLSAERLLKGAKRRREQLGLDDKTLEKSQQVLTPAIKETGVLTRPAAMEVLEQAGVSTAGGRGYHILWYLSQTGVTYIGPMEGKQQTVALLEETKNAPATREAQIAELARRYFTSHGPATLQDFRWWTGLTVADARAGLEANHSSLTSETVEGKEYWLPKQTRDEAGEPGSFLLPGFDEYMLGYTDRSAALHNDHAQKIIPGGNGMFLSTIVIGGQVVGTWKRTLKKDRVVITISPFNSLTATARKSLQDPADQYGQFLGLPATLE